MTGLLMFLLCGRIFVNPRPIWLFTYLRIHSELGILFNLFYSARKAPDSMLAHHLK